jgi:hypothetical protein
MRFKDFDQIIEYLMSNSPITYLAINLNDRIYAKNSKEINQPLVANTIKFCKGFSQMRVAHSSDAHKYYEFNQNQ